MAKVIHNHQMKAKTLPEEVAKLKDQVRNQKDEIERLKDVINGLLGDKKAIIEGDRKNGNEEE
jgi:cell division protein FtsL